MRTKPFSLREHQIEAVEAIETNFKSGIKRTLAVLATGSGKTMIYLYLAHKWVNEGNRVLILAHRRELIHQPVDRAAEYFPSLSRQIGVVMADQDKATTQLTIATVQTASKGRLVDDYDYIILDECHHGTAKSYLDLFKQYPKARWLGLTATPFRTDGDSLSGLFESVSYRFPITKAVDRGVLVPFTAYGFTLPITVEGITETIDGWSERALGSLLSADNAIEVVYEKWKSYCSDRQTICFTASVSQAHATAKYFRERGVQAQAVDGSTPKKKRDGILRLFRHRKIQVVCNCQVWTEGVDVPEASAALMVCPTKSDLAYVQKLGRILRTAPGKTDAIVLDFAPLEDRNIVMAGDILGVPRVEKVAKEKAKKAGILVRATRVDPHGLTASVDPSELLVETLNYLRKGFLAWSLQGTMAVASLSESVMLAIELPDTDRLAKAESMKRSSDQVWNDHRERLYQSIKRFRLWKCDKVETRWMPSIVGEFPSMEGAINACEKLIDLGYRPSLAKKRKSWRSRPVSTGQLSYMKSLNIDIPEDCNQGQAAQLISHEITVRTIAKVRPVYETQIMKGNV